MAAQPPEPPTRAKPAQSQESSGPARTRRADPGATGSSRIRTRAAPTGPNGARASRACLPLETSWMVLELLAARGGKRRGSLKNASFLVYVGWVLSEFQGVLEGDATNSRSQNLEIRWFDSSRFLFLRGETPPDKGKPSHFSTWGFSLCEFLPPELGRPPTQTFSRGSSPQLGGAGTNTLLPWVLTVCARSRPARDRS